jgi:hypothetical protein
LKILKIRAVNKFLMGDESFVMNKDGSPLKEFTAGDYRTVGLNYDLTVKNKETVFNILPKDKAASSENYLTIKLSDYASLKEDIPTPKLKIIAKHMAKIIGVDEIEVEDDDFMLPWFKIEEKPSEDEKLDRQYSASPFFTREQAERQIEFLKKSSETEKFPFNPNSLEIEQCDEYERFTLTLSQMIEYIETFGIKFNLPEFLEQKKGAIAANKFGF